MNTMYSTNDPLFFLHHANVDRYFSIWQSENPGATYDGTNTFGSPASLSDDMTPLNAKVGEAFERVPNANYCYTYSGGVRPPSGGLTRRQNAANLTLQYSTPVPREWILKMGGDVNATEEVEALMRTTVDKLNTAGYVSPAAVVSKYRSRIQGKWSKVEGNWRFAEGSSLRSQLSAIMSN